MHRIDPKAKNLQPPNLVVEDDGPPDQAVQKAVAMGKDHADGDKLEPRPQPARKLPMRRMDPIADAADLGVGLSLPSTCACVVAHVSPSWSVDVG